MAQIIDSTTSFIRVYYGENKELMCNPNCQIRNLLDDIRRRSIPCCEDSDVIDLSDTRGNLQNLDYFSQFQQTDASHHLINTDRGEYILIKLEYDETGNQIHIPLLQKACFTFPLILDNLDIPIWVEGAALSSGTRKINKLRLATRLTMAVAHEKKQKPPSGKQRKVASRGTSVEYRKDRKTTSSGDKNKRIKKKSSRASLGD